MDIVVTLVTYLVPGIIVLGPIPLALAYGKPRGGLSWAARRRLERRIAEGMTLLEQGDTDRGLALLESVAAEVKVALGAEHPITLDVQHIRAGAYYLAGDLETALDDFEEVLAAHERVLGEGHARTLDTRTAVAATLWASGEPERSADVLGRCLRDAEALWGPAHHESLALRWELAQAQLDCGRLDEAVALAERGVAVAGEAWGPDSRQASSARQAVDDLRSGTGHPLDHARHVRAEASRPDLHPDQDDGPRPPRRSWTTELSLRTPLGTVSVQRRSHRHRPR